MKYDNERDRFANGFDAGTIVDGEVQQDPETKEFVLVDDEGVAFSSQSLFKLLTGKRVRFSCVAFDAMENIEKMMVQAQTKKDGN
jgi:hypothetical protein